MVVLVLVILPIVCESSMCFCSITRQSKELIFPPPESISSVVTCCDHQPANKIKLFISLMVNTSKTECISLGIAPPSQQQTPPGLLSLQQRIPINLDLPLASWGKQIHHIPLFEATSHQCCAFFTFPFNTALSKRKTSDKNGSETSRYSDFASFWRWQGLATYADQQLPAFHLLGPKVLVHQVQGK